MNGDKFYEGEKIMRKQKRSFKNTAVPPFTTQWNEN